MLGLDVRTIRRTSNGNGNAYANVNVNVNGNDNVSVNDDAGSDVFTPSSYKIYFLRYHNNSRASRRPRTSRTPKKIYYVCVSVCVSIRNTFAYTCVAKPKQIAEWLPTRHEACQKEGIERRAARKSDAPTHSLIHTYMHTYIHTWHVELWLLVKSNSHHLQQQQQEQ